MKSTTLKFSALTNKEFLQYITLFVGIADAANPVQSKIKPQRDALDAIKTRLTNAIAAEDASLLTKVIEEQDLQRDLAISGFVAWIRSYRNFPVKAKKDAALVIDNYIKSLGGNLANLNYQAETATLTKLYNDCQNNTQLANALTTLGADSNEWLTAINTSNTSFENSYEQRSSEIGVAINNETFYSIRPAAIEALADLIKIISSRETTLKADAGDATALTKALQDIEATNVQYKQLIKATLQRKKEVPADAKNDVAK